MLQVSSLVALPLSFLAGHAGADCANSEPIILGGNSCKACQLKQVGRQASSVLQNGAKPTMPDLRKIGVMAMARWVAGNVVANVVCGCLYRAPNRSRVPCTC